LTFPLLRLFLLQQTIKSIQRHLHEFLDELAQGEFFELLTSGAVTHARAKLKEVAFTKLNQACVLPTVYGPDYPIQRWRGHRLLAVDSSLVRLPESEELGQPLAGKKLPINTGAPALAIRRLACRWFMICSTELAWTRGWNRARWAR